MVLVRQFRKPVERDMIEAVAGPLAPGEDPAACAARELAEETGYAPASLPKLGSMYPAPGYTDERLHIYFAAVGGRASGHAPDADERIENVCLSTGELSAMIRDGRLEDAKALSAWALWTARAGGAGEAPP